MKVEMKNRIDELKGTVKAGFWWLISGGIIAIIIGFAWGGWETAVATQKMSDEAVLASQSAICVAQFMKDPNREVRLSEFKEMDSWKRYQFIEKAGWDRMPGQEKASSGVAHSCAAGIAVLIKN